MNGSTIGRLVPAYVLAPFGGLNPLSNVFNIGTDASLLIMRNDTGAQIALDGKRRSMTYRANDRVINNEPIDDGGVMDHRVIPGSWSITLEAERSTGDFSEEQKATEAQFFAGGPQVFYTITLIEPNADKTQSVTSTFIRAVQHGYDVGPYEREQTVRVRVEFTAALRV